MSLFRPFTGRLHCGIANAWTERVPDEAVPAIHWPAPLRPAEQRGLGDDRLTVPAIHWPAPLRHSPSLLASCMVAAVPAIHWPAPLRRHLSRPDQRHIRLFRPFTGRLHCGGRFSVRPAASRICSGHSLAGSIAALMPRGRNRRRSPAVPAIHWPAPLRQSDRDHEVSGLFGCSGHSLAGSIAARIRRCRFRSSMILFRPSVVGSIAARTRGGPGRCRRCLFRPSWPAPLRLRDEDARTTEISHLFRPSLAGSIAARTRGGPGRCRRCLFRPFTGQLHCGGIYWVRFAPCVLSVPAITVLQSRFFGVWPRCRSA